MTVRRNNVLTIMKKELRRFFGDRRMLLTIILPGLLIYIIYSLMGNALSENLLGGGEAAEYRVMVHNSSEAVSTIVLNAGLNVTFFKSPEGESYDAEFSPENMAESLGNGTYHLYMVFPEDFDAKVAAYDPLGGQPAPEVRMYYNSANQDSAMAYSLMLEILNAFESSMANRFDVNVSPDETFDVATEEDMTGMIFSMLMPMLLVMLTFSSCMAMTTESIAGEKERGTIATLLVTPVKRSELAIGKIAALSLISLVAGLCNFLGVLLALPKLMGGEDLDMVNASVYGMTDYLMILAVILSTVLMFVALIAILSALAGSVKEASGLVSPLMLVVTVIGVSGMFGSGTVQSALFAIPVYNSVQCISGIFSMSISLPQILITVASNLITAGILAWILTRMFNSERIMFKK
ncbi:MAG: ABC transporter permease [Ruminococcaceae bacterium]|nr:ABC transporter permease [Oscillospiraceae bacterium]